VNSVARIWRGNIFVINTAEAWLVGERRQSLCLRCAT
jgi:hypothetical protein